MANKHMQRCSTSLAIIVSNANQNHSGVPLHTLFIKKDTIASVDEDLEALES